MTTGLAGALLVFTGIWHATEWLMDGRRRDTMRLIPVGILYAVLGYLIVTVTGGSLVLIAALVLTFVGMCAAFFLRKSSEVRAWVTWSFILIDVVIVVALAISLTA
ncbi:MAG: hypothetical protein AAGD04_08860 [Pseudomonadota bacterium]